MTSSYAHQEVGLQRIIKDGYVHGLLWGMGAGKSRTTIKAIEALSYELNRPIKVLIVAPKSVLRTWSSQFQEHCTEQFMVAVLDQESIAQRVHRMENFPTPADINVLVLGYSTFSGRSTKEAVLRAVKKMAPDIMICDEGHALRGMSNTSRLMARIARHVPRRLLLTGTAMPNGYQDLYTQWAFLDPHIWTNLATGKMMSRGQWEDLYAIKGGFQGRQIVGWKNTEQLHRVIAQRSSTVNTRDCIDLPPSRTSVVRFALSPTEQKHYDEMKRDLLTVVEDETIDAANKIVSILRLRQITSGFLPVDDSVVEIGRTRHDMALDLIENILASETRVVVFGWSKHELVRLYDALLAKPPWGANVFKIDGSTSGKERQTYLELFGPDNPDRVVLLGQVSTVNAGINELVTASNSVFLSMTNSRADFEQAKARLDRPGQTKPVVHWVLAADGTIDTEILAANEGKADLEKALLDHVRRQQ